MVLPDPTNCSMARIIATDFYVKFYVFCNCFLTIVPVGLLVFFVLSQQLRKTFTLVNDNTKILFGGFGTLIVCHSIFVLLLGGSSLKKSFDHEDECEYRWMTSECLIFKVPIYFCIFGFSVTHLAMFIERWIATSFGRHGERCDSSILRAPILIFSIIVLTLSILYFIYHAENPKAPKAYCVSTTSLSAPSFDRTLQIVTIIDLFAMAGDFLVFLRSRKQMRRVNDNYSLNKAFTLRESLLSIKLLLPLSIVHTVFYTFYTAFSMFNRSRAKFLDPIVHVQVIVEDQIIISFYAIVICLSAVFLFRHFDSHVQLNIPKNETESHFTYLNNLFHGPQRQKNVLILPPLNVRKMKT
ncbi:hypothetical protein M3Y96_00394600 [Aphelenchoides besseyi]|nr:hypothetical protein M3Y96_00394600 [Aphelenchoides besseyi]